MTLRSSLQDFWQARSPRERRVLAGGFGLIVLVGAYALLWRPMLTDLARMEEQLPRLRAQAAQVARAGDEITRLRAQAPAGALDPAQLSALISRTAATHGLQGRVATLDKGRIRVSVSLDRAQFNAWMNWVDELHRGHRVVLASSKVSALDAPGIIRAEAEFALAAEIK